mmetsp:Transcript_8894/g.9008  ORF Transcript_8894/g.9008 Transcript_8894/m.9008 type:complete len:105 (+) Transcript_8894:517-831(+)
MANTDTENAIVEMNSIATMMLFTSTKLHLHCPNKIEPNRQDAMKHENTVPKGATAAGPKTCRMLLLIAGGQTRTNMYIDPSNKLWTNPIKIIFGSEKIISKPDS